MVVVDYSINERYRRNDHDQTGDHRRQLLLDDDDALDIAIANFCPRLRQAVSLLSRHKVGPLQQRVYLSDFQSSTTPSLPADGFSSSIRPPCNDRFVLAIPYFCEETQELSNHNYMVRWSIIAQCSHPDKAPEVILLGMDNSSIGSGYGDATLRRTHSSQRPQHLQRRQHQAYQIFQERYWQQFVASDVFIYIMQCLTKWDKINNDNSSLYQYCLLADQLYQCYSHFQLYKLKMSLKSPPAMAQPPSYLVQAYTQYKQLTRLAKSTTAEIDSVTTEINIELLTDLESAINSKDYDDRRNQVPLALVRLRAIISMVSCEQTSSESLINTEDSDENKVLLSLASVTATFPSTNNVASSGSNSKNTTVPNNSNGSLNKKYIVRILNPKLSRTTHQGAMMTMMLDAIAEQFLDTTMIDFVTYVRHVQHAAIEAYNCDVISTEEDKFSPDENDENPVQLLLEALNETFCDSPSCGNDLLDYQICNNSLTVKNTTNFIRFLLVDDDIVTENTQLKYILTIEYNKEMYKEFPSTVDTEIDTNQIKKIVPVVTLRSVYDDENRENHLNIDFDEIEEDNCQVKYNKKLATIIKIAAVDGMRKLRRNTVVQVFTRYNKRWSPTDPFFASSSASPPPYPSAKGSD